MSSATPSSHHEGTASHAPEVLLVTGSGRSGTSSLAGTFKRLGLHVPQPEVPPMDTNPRGFYEPLWVMGFHRRRLATLAVHNIDARPGAVDLVEELIAEGGIRDDLRTWLDAQLQDTPLVIKDPHAYWFLSLWKDVAQDLGVRLRLLTSLRHPAEVVGSREIAYGSNRSDSMRRIKETSNVAGWIHAALLTERGGRDIPRAFIRYSDLMTDWRAAVGRSVDQLGVQVNTDLASREPHDVDDFIDAGLQQSRLTWDDIRLPGPLRDLGEEVWQLVSGLVESPGDEGAMRRMDELHGEYDRMFEEAAAISFDHTKAEVTTAVRRATEKRDQRIDRLKRRVGKQRKRIKNLEEQSSGRHGLAALLGRRR